MLNALKLMKKYRVKVNGKVYEVELESVTELDKQIEVNTTVELPKSKVASSNKTEELYTLTAPMQGTIIGINVEPGQVVNKGDVVIILEAMKLENNVVAPVSGRIKEVFINNGQEVTNKEPLLTIE